MKNKLIKVKIARSFIERTAPTSVAFILVYLYFYISHAGDHSNIEIVKSISLALMLNAIARFLIAQFYFKKLLSTFWTYWLTISMVVINAFGWAGISYSVLFAEKYDLVGGILVTLCSFVFVANSIFHLSPVLYFLYLYTVVTLFPIFFKLLSVSNQPEYKNLFSVYVLFAVYIFYVIKQARKIHKEEKLLYRREIDLNQNIVKLIKTQKELEAHTLTTFHNERLTSLGEMSSSIAHEINNPLTIISGSVQVLLKKPEQLDPNVLDKVQKIHFASERIGKIIKTMKFFASKSEKVDIDDVEISRILDESLSLCHNRMKTSGISLELDAEEIKARCNLVQVSQIILNLLNNAIDALDSLDIQDKKIKIIVKKDYRNVVVRIINNGPVITKEIQERLFTPFFTSKSLGRGTGLGLSISKKLAENNNGNLKFDEFDNQTSFVLVLKASL